MLQYVVPLFTSILGGLIQGSASAGKADAQRRQEEAERRQGRKASVKAPVQLAPYAPPMQQDTGSRLAPQDPMVRSQAMDILRARMNTGA